MEQIVLIRGAGEVASAIAHKLVRSGFRVILTELPEPMCVHRGTSFSEAVFDGKKTVEGVRARLITSPSRAWDVWKEADAAVIVDPEAACLRILHPDIVVDAIMAKRNTGTALTGAGLVVGVGPGFRVDRDCHFAIETNNTDELGKVLTSGEPEADTRIPLAVGGLTFERVIRPATGGILRLLKDMGAIVKKDDLVGMVGDEELRAGTDGVIRAILRDGARVEAGAKLGEIDPRPDPELVHIIRSRMRTIAGGVLEAILMYCGRRK